MTKQKTYPLFSKKALSLCSSLIICQSTAYAEEIVDTELLLLVDVSGSINSSEYNLMMNGYSQAFRNLDIESSIGTGATGSIAVSLMFWSANDQQAVGVDWMKISDSASANTFADAIDASVRPYQSLTAIGSALTTGAQTFGLETGGAESNGFQSIAQIIDISGDGMDNDTPPDGDRAENVRTSRDATIAAGVDMINGLPIGNAGGALEQYYQDNVIASSLPQEAFTQKVETFDDVAASLEQKLTREIQAGADASVSAVPEPTSIFLLGIGTITLCLRRKRDHK